MEKKIEQKITENRSEIQPMSVPAPLPLQQRKPVNPVMKENTVYFLGLALLYSVCFAIAFYRNFIGITYPLITAVTLGVCVLFLKKSGILWKKSNWWYVGGSFLLGISTILTTSLFVVFFNTVGILLLITVFMLHQVYNDREWRFGQYICNLLFFYLCMIPEVANPFIHMGNSWKKSRQKEDRRNKNIKYIVVGILIGLPMLLILVELLSSADQIFSKFVGNIFHKFWSQIVFSPNLFLVLFLMILGFFGIYCFLSALTLNNMPEWKQKAEKKNPVTAITFLSMITVVYLIFCGIQILFLFTGGKLLPEGYTYAEYARQGFFQLLFVCIFNLVLVICCNSIFQHHKILKLLLLLCSGCTYIMIASSGCRMFLYISVYHLSFLRVLVLWFLALLVVMMAGVVRNVIKEDFPLFRYCTMVVTVFYLIFSFGRADHLIASYNMAQAEEEISYEDFVYLTNLSMDAVPALSKYHFAHTCEKGKETSEDFYGMEQREGYAVKCKACRMDFIFQRVLDLTQDMNARTFHISKYQARKAAEKYFQEKGS